MSDYLLGTFIRNKRESLGMSLGEFGRMCDISHTTIDCIEKGYDPRTGKEINITNSTFSKLSNTLGVPIAKLVELSQGIKEKPAPVSGSGQYPHGSDLLTPEQKEIVDRLIADLAKNHQSAD